MNSSALASSPATGSTVTCTMPSWSRRSMKHTPPRLRATSVQPARVTVWPIKVSSTRPQKWVRIESSAENPAQDSAGKPDILGPAGDRSKCAGAHGRLSQRPAE
ncbi:conserved exported hypothetical protein [Xanthomonas citri pv. citri]|nr:conserved exported hypothetical protein [Xanthomonas citri pv. citri]CEE45452.1 conserved exported hypothetical protein [Xanthomonas citri pv. citri]CEE66927.1 conserved exported hypothetical protein [Xanthomonas citri pv. citri]CEH60575.1 conserved exported hypothetical protein [Xanthomonas citri pv. citri]CEH74693.1 conserved exported hypothetical protein [Xanthomonas citri pv. citri]